MQRHRNYKKPNVRNEGKKNVRMTMKITNNDRNLENNERYSSTKRVTLRSRHHQPRR